MSDEGKRKPPRFPRPTDEDRDFPPTERIPVMIPPAPRVPAEPFKLLTVDEVPRPSWLIPAEFRDQIQKLMAGHNQILTNQRNMALQLDGYGRTVNERFDIFHRELAMLRATVVGDHAPRLGEVEKRTAGQKAKAAALPVGGGTLLTLVGSIAVAAWPQYAQLIGGLLRWFGVHTP